MAMLNKKTAVFFTDTYKTSVTNVLKSEFAKQKDSVGIIVATIEVENIFKNNLVDRIVPADSMLRYKIRNTLSMVRNFKSHKEKRKLLPFLELRSAKEKRIMNVLYRYNPEVVFVTDHAILDNCVKAVTDQGKGAKIVVPIDEFTLDKRMVNKNVDLYFVDNIELKHALISEGIAEERIEISDLPISSKYFLPLEYEVAAKKLNLDTAKKTILIAASYIGDDRFKKLMEELALANLNANIIFACGKNRILLALARAKGFIAFNESLDMNHALTVADLVILRPTTILLQEAIAKDKKIFTIYPIDKIEESNQNYLAIDKLEKFVDVKVLVDAVKEFLNFDSDRALDVVVKYTIDEDKEDASYQAVVEKASESTVDKDSAKKIIEKVLEFFL